MRLVADESVEAQIVDQLRRDGHDVFSVQEQAPSLEDEWVLSTAKAEQRILLTGDKDFGELVYRLNRASAGVILIRLAGLSNRLKVSTVGEAIRAHESELAGSFAVIEPGRIRIRRPSRH